MSERGQMFSPGDLKLGETWGEGRIWNRIRKEKAKKKRLKTGKREGNRHNVS